MAVYKYQGDYDEREVQAGANDDGTPVMETERLPRQFILGIPARDLTEEDWAELSKQQQKQALDSGLYKQVGAERGQRADSRRQKADDPDAAEEKGE